MGVPPAAAGPRLARNALLNLAGESLPILAAIVCIPFVLHGMGAERFGLLSLGWVVLGYFGVFDVGLGRAATKYVAEALGRGDHHDVPGIAWTALLTQAVLGAAGGITLVVLTPWLVEHLLHTPAALIGEARASFLLLALAVPLVLLAGSLRGVLEAAQRFDLTNAVKVPFSSANFLLPALGVVLHWRLPGIVALLVLARAGAVVTFFTLCVRQFPGMAGLPRYEGHRARQLLGFGGWVSVSSVVAPLLVYVDRFMIGALVSLAAVAFYTAPYEAITRLWVIPSSLVAVLFPTFSAQTGQGTPGASDALAARSVKYILLVLGPVVAAAVAFGPDILRLWLGAEIAGHSTAAWRVLAVGVLLNSAAQVPFTLLQAAGRPDLTAKFHLLELPVYLALAWPLVSRFGITGAAVAWVLRVALDGLLLFGACGRLRLLSFASFGVARVPRATLLLGLVGGVTIAAAQLPRFPQRVALGLLVLTAGTVVAWRTSVDAQDRSRFARLIGRTPAGSA